MTALRFIRSAFSTLHAAAHAAAAVEMHCAPEARDLRKLGISRKAFNAIRL